MKAATLKALAVHTAKEAGPAPGPDYRFGWGLLDVQAAAQFLLDKNDLNVHLLEETLASGEVWQMEIFPQAQKKITVTLAWTDPPGKAIDAVLDPVVPALVNDLDVRIVDSAGEQLPWILDPNAPDRQASRGDNFRDNIEKIEFSLPEAKPYKIMVRHKGELMNKKQDFSIAISFQSANAPRTLYWVGESGEWHNPTQWSLTSGGAPANTAPLPGDRVVVNEQSFSETDTRTISLSADATCTSLQWLCSAPATFQMQLYNLDVSRSFTIGSKALAVAGTGAIRLRTPSKGHINISQKDFLNAKFMVEQGEWTLAGTANIQTLEVGAGKLHLEGQQISAKKVVIRNAAAIALLHSTISVSEEAVLETASWTLSEAVLQLTDNATLRSAGVTWPGTIRVGVDASTTWIGQNKAAERLDVKGAIEVEGAASVTSLTCHPASRVTLAANSPLKADVAAAVGEMSGRIEFTGSEGALLQLVENRKYCFDFLDVRNLRLETPGVASVGGSGTVLASSGWQQKKCDELLYADFTYRYACTGGLAEFIDNSSGKPNEWLWQVAGGAQSQQQHPRFALAQPGKNPVTLTVRSGSAEHTRTLEVPVLQNPLAKNAVLMEGSTNLKSLLVGERYEWFLNGAALPAARDRVFNYNGEEGVYQVAAYMLECNSLSDAVTITAAGLPPETIVYPNPATDVIYFTHPVTELRVLGADGAVRFLSKAGTSSINVSEWAAGVYLLSYFVRDVMHRTKVIISK